MNNPPRVHHFIPQFWIKKFAAADGKLWAYDWKDDRIAERSPKQLMQVFNLYTIQPSGVDDSTLETIDNNKIDNEGSMIFDRVINGDHSQESKEKLAQFLAAQVMRDPAVIISYNSGAQEFALDLINVFNTSDHPTFLKHWSSRYPGASVTEAEYNHIKSLGLTGAENALEQIIIALETTEGLPELPFTDLVRSPDGRKVIYDRLLACNWTLKTTTSGNFVLGDTGVLYEKSDIDYLKAPLSNTTSLFLVPAAYPTAGMSVLTASTHEVMSLNPVLIAKSFPANHEIGR